MGWSVLLLVLVGLLTPTVWSYPQGAPNTQNTCEDMIPRHGVEPQRGAAPFEVKVDRTNYARNQPVIVTLQATGAYRIKGFSIQARRADHRLNQIEPIGKFSFVSDTQQVCLKTTGAGLTHSKALNRKHMKFTWNPSSDVLGHIMFKVTIVSSEYVFWVAEPSEVVSDGVSPTIPPRTLPKVGDSDSGPALPAIDLTTCGKTKGCYRNPPGCAESTCQALLTWQNRGDYVDFEMSGDTDGWIAVGFSEDTKMGKDSVTECVRHTDTDEVEVRTSWNDEDGKSNMLVENKALGLTNQIGAYKDGFVKCRFTRQKKVAGRTVVFDLDYSYYILMAWGKSTKEGIKLIHTMEPYKYPFVSKQMVNLEDNLNIDGTYRWILVKLHGILMIIAWMMCASVAILMARYYKLMWPNDRLCSDRVWFAVHRGCNLVTMFATIVGFVLIFIHVGGYSHMPDLPAKAHPPLGITVTILCILNPLLACCRCSNKSPKRPIFNWIHWFFGTCGVVLASPTLFIGLSLPKAFVPWWATWVMVAFVLFHLIIELMLEIHGCINNCKQKQRQQEFELRKRNDPRGQFERYEPEPVGRRFKKIILSLYLFVLIILGLVMIIAIAIG